MRMKRAMVSHSILSNGHQSTRSRLMTTRERTRTIQGIPTRQSRKRDSPPWRESAMAENEDKCEHDDVEAMRRRHLQIGLRFQRIAVYALQELEAKAASGQPLGLS